MNTGADGVVVLTGIGTAEMITMPAESLTITVTTGTGVTTGMIGTGIITVTTGTGVITGVTGTEIITVTTGIRVTTGMTGTGIITVMITMAADVTGGTNLHNPAGMITMTVAGEICNLPKTKWAATIRSAQRGSKNNFLNI
jgi:hypothetical protein